MFLTDTLEQLKTRWMSMIFTKMPLAPLKMHKIKPRLLKIASCYSTSRITKLTKLKIAFQSLCIVKLWLHFSRLDHNILTHYRIRSITNNNFILRLNRIFVVVMYHIILLVTILRITWAMPRVVLRVIYVLLKF